MLAEGKAGPQVVSDAAPEFLRLGRLGDLMVSELHGRFYEQNFRSNLYIGGMTATSFSNATFTSATLGVTCTPIAGVWNPATSRVNLVILQATLAATISAATNTGPGVFVWATSTGNAAISTGNAPFNPYSFLAAGSQAKDMSGVALTGLTNNLVVRRGSALQGGSLGSFSFVGTAVGQATPMGGTSVENIEGAFIVPPGGVLALLCTTTPVAHTASSGLVWEEVPIL